MNWDRALRRSTWSFALTALMAGGAAVPALAAEPREAESTAITTVQAEAAMTVWQYVRTHDWGRVLPLEADAEAHATNSKVAFDFWASFPMAAAKTQYGCEIEMVGNSIEYVPDVGADLHTVSFRGDGDCDRAINPETLVRIAALPVEERAAAAAFLAAGLRGGDSEAAGHSTGAPAVDGDDQAHEEAWNDSCGRFNGVEACLGRGTSSMLAFGLKNVGASRIVAYSLVGQATSLTGTCAPHSAIASTQPLPIEPSQFVTAQTRVSQNARWYNAVYLSPSDEYKGRHCAVV